MPHDDEHGHGRDREIGGVPVEIYEDGHVRIDSEQIASDVKHKVDVKVGQAKFGCIFGAVFLLVFAGLVAGTGYYVWQSMEGTGPAASTQASPAAATWDGATPLLCGGNDVVTVRNVTANLPGDVGVIAKANCQVTLVDCNINSGIGIQSVGNAKVRMEGGSLTGKLAAIDAQALSHVTLIGVEVKGKRKSTATARIQEKKAK